MGISKEKGPKMNWMEGVKGDMMTGTYHTK